MSFNLINYKNYKITIHWSFGLVILFVMLYTGIDQPLINLLVSLGIVFIIFGSVLFHEIAHLTMANLLGYKTDQIVLYPLGGVTKITERIRSSTHEFLISVIGPVSNFILAGILFLGLYLNLFESVSVFFSQIEAIIDIIIFLNIILGVFNLFIPVLPLDGGRVFKSLMTIIFPFSLAMKVTTILSLTFSLILLGLGFILEDPITLFIGIISMFSSYYIPKFSLIEHQLEKYKLGEEVTDLSDTVPANMSLHYVYEKMLSENKANYLVIDEQNKFQGIILKDDIRVIEPIYRLTTPAIQITRNKL